MLLKRFNYRNHTIILRQDNWQLFRTLRWFADVEPPEKDGLYEGDGWETPKEALVKAIQFIDGLINGDFADIEPQWQPIKTLYAKQQAQQYSEPQQPLVPQY